MAFFLFQFAFADTASHDRVRRHGRPHGFKGDLIYSFVVSGFIYPIFGHWIWGPDGWLATGDFPLMGGTPIRDFAGSTVVHTVGGVLALTGAIALGPRLGRKFKRDGGGMPPGHDLTLAALGAVILWFGWYGFNPGSHAVGAGLRGHRPRRRRTRRSPRAPAALVAMVWVYATTQASATSASRINGFLAGLVAITAPCYWVSPTGALVDRSDRRGDRDPRASTSPSGSGSTTRSARSPSTAPAASGAPGRSGLFATGDFGNPAVRGQGPLLRRRHRPAGVADRRQRRSSAVLTLPSGLAVMLGDQGHRPAPDLARGRARGASTSTSTARRRTTRSRRTRATRRCRPARWVRRRHPACPRRSDHRAALETPQGETTWSREARAPARASRRLRARRGDLNARSEGVTGCDQRTGCLSLTVVS